VPSMRLSSPERRWRAIASPVTAAVLGWFLSGSVRLPPHAGDPARQLPVTTRFIVTCLAVAVGLGLAVLIMRTHLDVGDEGLADHRVFRTVRLPWQVIETFEIQRPKGFRGGFCVVAVCRDGTTADLMATQAYSRVPSADHLDELHRICWSLEAAAARR